MNGLAQTSGPLSAGSLAQLTLSLLAIIALIIAVSWLLKRLKIAGPGGRGDIAVIDQLGLGPRERIVLVRVGDHQVLVGVGASGIVALTPLATPIAIANGAEAEPAFAERLRELMKRAGRAA